MIEIAPEILQKIIEHGDEQVLVQTAEQIGKELAALRLTTSQIRGIFGTVRRIEMDWNQPASFVKHEGDAQQEQADPSAASQGTTPERRAQRELMLLKPRMAYQARRERGRGVDQLERILAPAIDYIQNDKKRFKNFVDFFEAILAYHRAFGGSNN